MISHKVINMNWKRIISAIAGTIWIWLTCSLSLVYPLILPMPVSMCVVISWLLRGHNVISIRWWNTAQLGELDHILFNLVSSMVTWLNIHSVPSPNNNPKLGFEKKDKYPQKMAWLSQNAKSLCCDSPIRNWKSIHTACLFATATHATSILLDHEVHMA
jgi:hypothetical protein